MKRTAEDDLHQDHLSKQFKNDNGTLSRHEKGEISVYVKDQGLKQALSRKGIKVLFPIQYLTFKSIQEGKDIIARDRTGSGKTLAFSLPILQRMRAQQEFSKSKLAKFMVVLPTRELAIQVKDEIDSLRPKQGTDFRVVAVYGKDDIQRQISSIERGVDVIVGTPGRLIDLLQRGSIKTDSMQVLCLDEADEMLRQGFKEDVQKIMGFIKEKAPRKTQNLLFSATIPPWLEDLSSSYLDQSRAYVNLVPNQEHSTPDTLKHYSMKLTQTQNDQKPEIILSLMKKFATNSGHTIIFVEKKIDASELSRKLEKSGVNNRALHGDIPQNKRQEAFRSFKKGTLKVLVATNVCARGLDFPDIDLVVQAEPPRNTEPYVHRSGRTARKGKQGVCVTLFCDNHRRIISNIERQLKIQFMKLSPQDFLTNNHKREKTNGRSTQKELELVIKYLPMRESENGILDFFFSKGVKCSGIRLLKNSEGRSRGTAFLKFIDRAAFEKCLGCDGCEYEGNILSITTPNNQ